MIIHFDWEARGSASDTQISEVIVEFLDEDGAPVAGGGNLAYSMLENPMRSKWGGWFSPNTQGVTVRITAHSNSLNFLWDNPYEADIDWNNGNTGIIHVGQDN